jgi:hypothetical protein
VFRLLNEYDVMLEGILLKPNMILPGGFGLASAARCRQCDIMASCITPVAVSADVWVFMVCCAAP